MNPRAAALAASALLACGEPPRADDAATDAVALGTDAPAAGGRDAAAAIDAAAIDAARPIACTAGALACATPTTAAVCNAAGTAWASTTPCARGTRCETGACVGPIAWHLRNSADLQYVQSQDPASFARCASESRLDLLCDADRTMRAIRPRFGLFFATSWLTLDPSSANPCDRPGTAQGCIAARLRSMADHWIGDNPHLLLAGELSEMVDQKNVPASQWPAICRPGSLGQWGPTSCVPDIEHSAFARDYLVGWGEAFVDGGARAMVFGELTMMTGTGAGGGHTVSYTGAAGLNEIIGRIRAYATAHGVATVYFGAQAASSVTLGAGRPELVDFIEGAQHLEAVGGYLVQPLLASGSFVDGRYGPGDAHEANLLNDANGLPVLLDYDNWSSIPDFPDDIRYLASAPTDAARARMLLDHWRHLRAYNPRASLSIPVSKTLANDTGVVCDGVNGYQFSAGDCGLTAAARALFDEADGAPMTAAPGAPDAPIRPAYWGQQLRGRDDTVSWYYQGFLGRRPSAAEYANALAGLPALMAADAARCGFVGGFVNSAEFAARALSDADFVAVVVRTVLLREPDAAGTAYFAGELAHHTRSRAEVATDLCQSAESVGLYAAH